MTWRFRFGERQTAAQLASRVEGLVGKASVPGDYRRTATVAEVQLLQGAFDAAASLYQQAVLAAPEEHGSHLSTRKQAALLLDALQAPKPGRDAVLSAFDHPGCTS